MDIVILIIIVSIACAGALSVINSAHRNQSWYSFCWAALAGILLTIWLRGFDFLLFPGSSGGWENLVRLIIAACLLPLLPPTIALFVTRPEEKRIPIIIAFTAGSLVALHYFTTEPITLTVKDTLGAPVDGMRFTMRKQFGLRAEEFVSRKTDKNGVVHFTNYRNSIASLDTGESMRYRAGEEPNPTWMRLRISIEPQIKNVRADWERTIDANNRSADFRESVSSHFLERPRNLNIPVIAMRKDETIAPGYAEAWKEAWPQSAIEEKTLKSLSNSPETFDIHPFAELLKNFSSTVKALRVDGTYSPPSVGDQYRRESGVQAGILCEYVLNQPATNYEIDMAKLDTFIETKTQALLEKIKPRMKGDPSVYYIISKLGRSAESISKEYAKLYPNAAPEIRRRMLLTLPSLAPAPENILFAMADGSKESRRAFLEAMGNRPASESVHDWEVITAWNTENPGRLNAEYLSSLEKTISERRKRN